MKIENSRTKETGLGYMQTQQEGFSSLSIRVKKGGSAEESFQLIVTVTTVRKYIKLRKILKKENSYLKSCSSVC